jgi:hypothetical protein
MNPRTALVGLRAAVGVSAYATPNLAGKLFGLDPDANPQAAYLARLFAARDLALAAGTQASDGPARTLWLQAGLACDVADVGAALLGRRDDTLPALTTVLLAGTAASAVFLGLRALQQEPS